MVFIVRTVNPALLALDPSTSDGQSSAAPSWPPSPPRARRSPAALLGGLIGLSRRRFGASGSSAYVSISAQPSSREPLDVWVRACKLKPETVEALRPILGQENSGPFLSFLDRLGDCASFEKRHRADSVRELGNILKLVASSDAYRALCFDLASGADSNCHDNTDVIFGNLRLAARDPTFHGDASLEQVLKYHKSCVPWSLIDDFVSETFPSFAEPLEKVLALRIRLSDLLPVKTPAMHFSVFANVDHATEKQARAYIAARRRTKEHLLRNLCRSPAWHQFLAQRHPVEFVANTLLWDSALQDVMKKTDDGGSLQGALQHPDTESFGSRTEALARARAMPGIGTGRAFQHLQKNATVRLMEDMTRRLVVDKQPPPKTEAKAYANLLGDPDWLTYLEREHPDDEAFASGSLGAQDRHERLMLLTQQEIADARAG
ncbi:putative type III effector protein (plasmid) [Ralstonia solanacearum Po82]|uniref:Type III effector protein n=2 Tax=Ralstonia solanacearum TaxID=305 RepID=A0A5H2Q577_RALSL|nr:NEL-type E3 ubiquitin ligase domain-containing protein [Ralstonia solanacearum]AEG71233.1 putative type III effector protein [Ralstonia solanacearum Po82]AMP75937.1 type III effector protein [Ralstonia solanacearum]AYB62634.1 type III effector protein [Ralstonia solanacearum]